MQTGLILKEQVTGEKQITSFLPTCATAAHLLLGSLLTFL